MRSGKKIHIVLLWLFFAYSFSGFSQNAGKKIFADKAPEVRSLNFEVLESTQSSPPVLFNKQPLLLSYQPKAVDYFKSLISKQSNTNYLTPKKPQLEEDVIVKKYFEGQDRSVEKMRSDFDLGTYTIKSPKLVIMVQDFAYIDSDRIKVSLNGNLLQDNIKLEGDSYVIEINLNDGYNRIDIRALNQGFSGYNTAGLKVYDGYGHLIADLGWYLATSQVATLGIIKEK